MATTTPNYDINYDDKRFTDVKSAEAEALDKNTETFGNMIGDVDSFYNDQIAASQAWAEEQKKLQQEQTDFAIEKIEQQKEYAEKDYTKEQSGAYTDWQKQSGQYGANAEAQAANGLAGSGYSESSQVAMYNQYQNRVAIAREAIVRARAEYDNQITEAKLQNNAILAEIAYNAYKEQLELALEGFQYKNSLIMEQANRESEIKKTYYEQYIDVLEQMNHENALAEEVRQFGITSALQERQVALSEVQFAWQKEQAEKAKIEKPKTTSAGASYAKNSTSAKAASGIKNAINGTPSKSSTKSSDLKVDTKSLIAAAGKPVSAAEADRLIKAGKIVEYEVDGVLKYAKNFTYQGNYKQATQTGQLFETNVDKFKKLFK